MPSYQTTAFKIGENEKTEMIASHEFEAPSTAVAKRIADDWSNTKAISSSGATIFKLYAGKVLLSERTWESNVWLDVKRS